MTVPPEQIETVAFLRSLAGADPIETHISLVFVGADTVWKLRKAVRLSYLDFSSLASRRHFACRELELNAPPAPGLYRDVVAVLRRPDGSLTLGDGTEAGEPVDWVVRMAVVPPGQFLERIAMGGGLTPALLDAMADAVAGYHMALAPARDGQPADAIRLATLGNARSALEAGLKPDAVRAWLDHAMARVETIAGWLDQRGRDGFVRRAHGDLHLGNMCLWHGRPVPFDAIEFDEALATIDLGYDLAFLLMDVDHRVGRKQANHLLNRYVARLGDAALTRGLPLFLSLRAFVRAHVEARRGRTALAGTYLRAAETYLRHVPPLVIAIGGLQGTGKSTLARALAPPLGVAPGALVLRSDEIRKRQHGVAPEQPLPESAYGEAANAAVMRTLLAGVGEVAGGGHAVIADATFLDTAHRAGVEQAARSADVPFLGLWLEAPLTELEARIAARRNDASDATIAVLRDAHARYLGGGAWLTVDASTVDGALAAARRSVEAVVRR